MYVAGIHQGGGGMLSVFTAYHDALLVRGILSLPPQGWGKIDVSICAGDLASGGPSSGTVLAAAHGLGFDVGRTTLIISEKP